MAPIDKNVQSDGKEEGDEASCRRTIRDRRRRLALGGQIDTSRIALIAAAQPGSGRKWIQDNNKIISSFSLSLGRSQVLSSP